MSEKSVNTESRPTLVIKGRGVVKGKVSGEALVTRETISGWGGIDRKAAGCHVV